MGLIDRQVAIDAVDVIGHIVTMPDGDKCIRRSAVKYTLSMLPSAQPKTGMWIPQDFNKSDGMKTTTVYYFPKCSVCGYTASPTNYCPNCGAHMKGSD